jgi:hypothetical protein
VRDRLSTAIEIIGLATIGVGCVLIHPALGLVAAGFVVTTIGYAMGRSPR